MKQFIISTFITAIAMSACTASAAHASTGYAAAGMALSASNAEAAPADNTRYTCQRPKEADRLFVSDTIEKASLSIISAPSTTFSISTACGCRWP